MISDRGRVAEEEANKEGRAVSVTCSRSHDSEVLVIPVTLSMRVMMNIIKDTASMCST